jgi:ketosteroid isomerase-like protein
MSEGNVEIVRRGYALFVAGDLEAVAALFSTDAELAGAGGLGVAGTAPDTRYGPEGFIRATEDALEAFEDYRVEAEEFIDAGESVVVPFGSPAAGGRAGRRWRHALRTYGSFATAR